MERMQSMLNDLNEQVSLAVSSPTAMADEGDYDDHSKSRSSDRNLSDEFDDSDHNESIQEGIEEEFDDEDDYDMLGNDRGE